MNVEILALRAIVGLFVVLGLVLVFWAFRLYIIQRLRAGGLRRAQLVGDFMPGGFHGLGCGNVGMDTGEQVSGWHGEGVGGGDDSGIADAAALACKVECAAGHADAASGRGIAAKGALQGVEGAFQSGQGVGHVGAVRRQDVDINESAPASVVSVPMCYVRSVTSKRGFWIVSAQSLQACLRTIAAGLAIRARAVEDSRSKVAAAAVTGGASVPVVGGREKSGLDAPDLLAAGGVAWSPGGGHPATVLRAGCGRVAREGAWLADVLGLQFTGRDLVSLRGEDEDETVVRFGYEVGAIDAPERVPAGGMRAHSFSPLVGSRQVALSVAR